jgi:hypothetical protein
MMQLGGLSTSWLKLIGGGLATLVGFKDEPTMEAWPQ